MYAIVHYIPSNTGIAGGKTTYYWLDGREDFVILTLPEKDSFIHSSVTEIVCE